MAKYEFVLTFEAPEGASVAEIRQFIKTATHCPCREIKGT